MSPVSAATRASDRVISSDMGEGYPAAGHQREAAWQDFAHRSSPIARPGLTAHHSWLTAPTQNTREWATRVARGEQTRMAETDESTLQRAKAMAAKDDFPLIGFSHLEWWVGNAFQTAQFFRSQLGFAITGYRGPETGTRETASYLLEQGEIRFIVTGAMGPDHPVSDHVLRHGPGVHDVAILVPDAEAAFEIALERGADPAAKPYVVEDDRGRAVFSAIQIYGDTIHSFVERDGDFPGFEPREDAIAETIGLEFIDHVVANVELGKMDHWVEFYERVFGFTLLKHFDDDAISTKYTALMSKVMWDGTGIIN